MIDLHIIQQAVHESRDGITIVDLRQKGWPVVFVNPAFERITGYTATEALGRNCRYLQGYNRKDRNGEATASHGRA